jgi:peptide deformylase
MNPSMPTDARPEGLPRIVQAGDPVLRAEAKAVPADEIGTVAFRDLVETMVAVMRAAPGVGLAAPQIGVSKQVIVVEDQEEFLSRLSEEARAARERAPVPLTVIVNPTLRLVTGRPATFFEGCLSVTGYMALVPRALEVEVTGLDATTGTAVPRVWRLRGWPARILQHEVDHLRGTLYVDRMHARSLCGPDETHRWAGRTTEDVAAALGVDIQPARRPPRVP